MASYLLKCGVCGKEHSGGFSRAFCSNSCRLINLLRKSLGLKGV